MTFDEAVAHVRATQVNSVAAFAFVPTSDDDGAVIGGAIYVVTFAPDLTDDDDPILVEYTSGEFGISHGDEESFALRDIPDDARSLTYRISTTYDRATHGCNVETVWRVLRGKALDESLVDDEEYERRTWSLTRTTEADIGRLLLARGIPATMRTPAGLLPAIVLLIDSEECQDTLIDAFGGLTCGSPDGEAIVMWI